MSVLARYPVTRAPDLLVSPRIVTVPVATGGGTRQAPVFVSHTLGTNGWASITHPKTASVAVVAGDRIQVFGVSEDSGTTIATPGDGGVNTYTLRQSNVIASSCATYYWNATAATTTTLTVSVDSGGSGNRYDFAVLVWRGSDGFGASNKAGIGSGTATMSLTTTQDNSAVVSYIGDWAAVDGASRGWSNVGATAATEVEYSFTTGVYTVYGAYWLDAAGTGSKTLALSAPGGQTYTMVGAEVLGKAAGGDAALTPGDTLGLSDTGASQVLDVTDSFDDALGLADDTAPASAFARQVDDTLGLSDVATPVLTGGGTGFTATVDDLLGLSDAAAAASGFARQVDDLLGLADTASTATAFARQLDDALGLTDTASGVAAFGRVPADTLGLSDATSTASVFARQVDDPAGLSDAATPVLSGAGTRQVDDLLGLSDNLTLSSFTPQVLDTLALTDAAVVASVFTRQVNDTLGLADTAGQAATGGVTARPNSGITPRPFTGTTLRP